MTGNMD